jgi:pyrroloquinoline quinone biosynthesis protein B
VSVEAILLGTAQDAGVPQAGCGCANCRKAWDDPESRQLTACLALVDHTNRQSWLIDATPDFKAQLQALRTWAPGCALAGIALTHAHIGHYTGLMHLGREAMAVREMPVHATPTLGRFLAQNAPWSQLVALRNIELYPLHPGHEHRLGADLYLTPLRVPHRNEFADTVAFMVRGRSARLLYCPDTDGWDAWERDVRSVVGETDVALLDGTFFSAGELSGRDLSEIPHPLVVDTVQLLDGVESDVRLIHLNHSNPLFDAGPEREWLAAHGMGVGAFGDRWTLG